VTEALDGEEVEELGDDAAFSSLRAAGQGLSGPFVFVTV